MVLSHVDSGSGYFFLRFVTAVYNVNLESEEWNVSMDSINASHINASHMRDSQFKSHKLTFQFTKWRCDAMGDFGAHIYNRL